MKWYLTWEAGEGHVSESSGGDVEEYPTEEAARARIKQLRKEHGSSLDWALLHGTKVDNT